MADIKGTGSYGRDIYSVNFADYLPETLKRDPKMKALAAAVAEQMLGVSKEISDVLIYSRIGELPEELIDILAFDMHVDWYDYSLPLDIKRDILKNSVRVHKKIGTKYAVEKTLKALYLPQSKIEEWFEYGGNPYCFRILFSITDCSCDVLEVVKTIRIQKRCSAHLDCIIYKYQTRSKVTVKSYAKVGDSIKVKPKTVKEINADVSSIKTEAVIFEKNELKIKPYAENCIKTGTNIKSDVTIVQNDSIYISAKER